MLSAYPVALHRDGPLQMKTPGRALKRDARQENMYRVPMTVAAKSKSALTPHRPLTANARATESQKTLKVKPFITISRPLGDKTPFPNRVANDAQSQTPSPLNEKLAKLSLEEPGPAIVPGALLRPSSARTSLRIPRTSGGKYEFKTPITQGNHWDVSDGDIDVEPEIQPDEQEAVQEEDYDEIEYMPPTAIIPPYEPPFEMPDYTVLGKTMWEMMHSVKFDDSADLYYAADIEIEIDRKIASSPDRALCHKMRLIPLKRPHPDPSLALQQQHNRSKRYGQK
ncbi:predicted protein [Postia placenta Mad-698-R]|nr:predicted protein [Postia placenta Mad-698-R]